MKKIRESNLFEFENERQGEVNGNEKKRLV